MMVLFLWLSFSVIIGIAASRRFNRSSSAWCLIAAVLSPLVAVCLLFALGPADPKVEILAPRKPVHAVDKFAAWVYGRTES